ncbi:MAG: 3-keto-disaccharide hydrolase [Pirellulales bacterium]|jgi:quinoprotein glucose dehydrogenase
MKLSFLLILLSISCSVGSLRSALAEGKNAAKEDNSWIALFDGQTTKGWTPREEVVSFKAVDGELQLLSKKNVWVTSDLKVADFIFEGEAKIPQEDSKGFNSGFAFRCQGETGKPKGYQCEIESADPGSNGGVYGIGLGGWLYPKADQKEEHRKRISGVFKPKDWNKYRIICQGPRIQVFVNEVLITDVEHKGSLSGYFGIQHHGHGGMVSFRNLRIKKTSKAQ